MRGRVTVVGVLNTTPDSFSDGGRFMTTGDTFDLEAAAAAGLALVAEGVDVLDVGGESTRPGARETPTEIELVRTIADEKGPFRGRWEYDITAQEQGSKITITEHGEIPNPFFRFMARVFMDPAMYLELYLKALAKKFNEPAVLEKTVAKQPAPTDNTAKSPEAENQPAANQESRSQP